MTIMENFELNVQIESGSVGIKLSCSGHSPSTVRYLDMSELEECSKCPKCGRDMSIVEIHLSVEEENA